MSWMRMKVLWEAEAIRWERWVHDKEMFRLYPRKYNSVVDPSGVALFDPRLAKDPAKERLFKRRRRDDGRVLKEHKKARQAYQRTFKMRMKKKLLSGDDDQPVVKEYKTYGWLTW